MLLITMGIMLIIISWLGKSKEQLRNESLGFRYFLFCFGLGLIFFGMIVFTVK